MPQEITAVFKVFERKEDEIKNVLFYNATQNTVVRRVLFPIKSLTRHNDAHTLFHVIMDH